MDQNDGAIPVEEFAVLQSEVHHLKDDFREHKTDTRQRIKSVVEHVDALKTTMVENSTEIHGLGKTMKWVGVILATVLASLLTKVFIP